VCFFFSSRRRHTRLVSDWSSDVCSSDLPLPLLVNPVSGARSRRKTLRLEQRGRPSRKYVARARPTSAGKGNGVELPPFPQTVIRSEERRVGQERRARG